MINTPVTISQEVTNMQTNSAVLKQVKTKPAKIQKEVRGKQWSRKEKESKQYSEK